MNSFTRVINGAPFLDELRLWNAVSKPDSPVPARLSDIMRFGGVRFHDEEPGGYNFVLEPTVAISGFGGFGFSFDETTPEGELVFNGSPTTPEKVIRSLRESMGLAGFYSYGNPGNHKALAMDEVTTREKHFSKAHLVQVDLVVLGYSLAIEGNLMLLRRWFNHVGRFTNTRCKAQSGPPLVVMNPLHLPAARLAREAAGKAVASIPAPKRGDKTAAEHRLVLADHYESVNSLWPSSRALILKLDSGLANLRGCMGDMCDMGQELEVRHILAKICDVLHPLFPELFPHSSEYGYEMPAHWPGRPSWEAARDQAKPPVKPA